LRKTNFNRNSSCRGPRIKLNISSSATVGPVPRGPYKGLSIPDKSNYFQLEPNTRRPHTNIMSFVYSSCGALNDNHFRLFKTRIKIIPSKIVVKNINLLSGSHWFSSIAMERKLRTRLIISTITGYTWLHFTRKQ
jgi:hypothetical protein